MHVRFRQAQVIEESIRHDRVVMLTRVDEHVVNLRPRRPFIVFADGHNDRRDFHKIWPRSDYGDYLDLFRLGHVIFLEFNKPEFSKLSLPWA